MGGARADKATLPVVYRGNQFRRSKMTDFDGTTDSVARRPESGR
jgi:hypothetical protein